MNNSVIIIVPIYKTEFDKFELISVTQLFKVLNKYPIAFVMPEGLQFDIDKLLGRTTSNITNEYFAKSYFESKADYSRLCLSKEFYQRFNRYKYMLIYQTDAFVFSDRLEEFVDAEFDYIGAPQDNDGFKNFHVGNGGLSLRKIDKAIEILDKRSSILFDLPEQIRNHYLECEDNFWGYCGYKKDIDFNVPGIDFAGKFALMGNKLDLYGEMIESGLPFGLHAWSYCDYGFWKPIIESLGYKLPDENKVPYSDECRENYINIMHAWWDCITFDDMDAIINSLNLSKDESYTIWGYGKYGKKVLAVFEKLGLTVDKVMDVKVEHGRKNDEGILLVNPNSEEISDSKVIIISVKNAYAEIKENILYVNPNIRIINVNIIIDIINQRFKEVNSKENIDFIRERILKTIG
ncbi:MAG: hypothetical protein IJJ59_06960 [Pseudobutyrivibrio sp.]|uniref:DUF5672 family protein n=1 Tax=Pseudobutyrivibrio sp. TaxID=2014367 RepID=UPI0025DB41F5|nr:DUF5672 family protein [Pseudobutyrivibrio sp.]MBQ6463045.1 hypothetical protein [Pseudobutyrivibrio sp.]